MNNICLAVARFNNNKKEAISKNFINLAEGFAKQGYQVSTFTPTRFNTEQAIHQDFMYDNSNYCSLKEALLTLFRICKKVNKHQEQFLTINFHIATPVELFFLYFFLDHRSRKKTIISIWQSYLTLKELKHNIIYFLQNLVSYFHIILLNSFLLAFIYKILLKKFKRCIVHNIYQRDQLTTLSGQHIIFVQNGVVSENSSIPPRPHNTKFVILYIGHAKESKGVDKLLKIAYLLQQRKNLDFTLVLSLSGFGDEEALRRQAKNYGIEYLLIFKRHIDVIQEMAKADLFILPLRTCVGTSLTPNVILEALSVGLPIAVPDHAELDAVIRFGSNAIKLNIADLITCVKSIENVATNNEFLKSISRNQREIFKEKFTLEQFVNNYIHQLCE